MRLVCPINLALRMVLLSRDIGLSTFVEHRL